MAYGSSSRSAHSSASYFKLALGMVEEISA